MNRQIGSAIANENVKEGQVLWCKTRSLGAAMVKIHKDLGLGGWAVEIVEGQLQSPVSKDRRWTRGSALTLPVTSVDRWYEIAGDIA